MRKLFFMVIVLFLALSIAGCGSSKKEPEVADKGSLNRTYKLIDDSGLEYGTLILTPMGRGELRDSDGKIIGTFAPDNANPEPAIEKAVEKPAE